MPAGLSDDDAALAEIARDFHERQTRIRAAKGGGVPPLAVVPIIRPVPVPGSDGEPVPERITPDQVVALWSSRQPFPPDPQSLQRQAVAAAWLAKQPAEHVVRAMVGITLVWPHKPPKSEPWTCADVQAKWDKALQASEQHPALADARTAEAINNRMNGG